jgi:hypothetical protein
VNSSLSTQKSNVKILFRYNSKKLWCLNNQGYSRNVSCSINLISLGQYKIHLIILTFWYNFCLLFVCGHKVLRTISSSWQWVVLQKFCHKDHCYRLEMIWCVIVLLFPNKRPQGYQIYWARHVSWITLIIKTSKLLTVVSE